MSSKIDVKTLVEQGGFQEFIEENLGLLMGYYTRLGYPAQNQNLEQERPQQVRTVIKDLFINHQRELEKAHNERHQRELDKIEVDYFKTIEESAMQKKEGSSSDNISSPRDQLIRKTRYLVREEYRLLKQELLEKSPGVTLTLKDFDGQFTKDRWLEVLLDEKSIRMEENLFKEEMRQRSKEQILNCEDLDHIFADIGYGGSGSRTAMGLFGGHAARYLLTVVSKIVDPDEADKPLQWGTLSEPEVRDRIKKLSPEKIHLISLNAFVNTYAALQHLRHGALSKIGTLKKQPASNASKNPPQGDSQTTPRTSPKTSPNQSPRPLIPILPAIESPSPRALTPTSQPQGTHPIPLRKLSPRNPQVEAAASLPQETESKSETAAAVITDGIANLKMEQPKGVTPQPSGTPRKEGTPRQRGISMSDGTSNHQRTNSSGLTLLPIDAVSILRFELRCQKVTDIITNPIKDVVKAITPRSSSTSTPNLSQDEVMTVQILSTGIFAELESCYKPLADFVAVLDIRLDIAKARAEEEGVDISALKSPGRSDMRKRSPSQGQKEAALRATVDEIEKINQYKHLFEKTRDILEQFSKSAIKV